MKIKRMTATFGRLQNETLELGEGLNLIQAPNEAGKSTWSAFIRAMLYGIPTKERDRQGFIAEKNRYQPWNGSAMEGRMEIEWNGRLITLLRSQNRTVPFGKFEAVDTRTGEPIPELTAENVGETLIGAPREVFERSAFVGQGATAVDGSPALEKRISALVSSGEEDVSGAQVERKLKDWLNRRKHNKTGWIPELEQTITELNEAAGRQSKAHRTAEEALLSLDGLRRERDTLAVELAYHKAAAEQKKRTAWEQAQSELSQARAEEEKYRAELRRDGMTPDREVLRRTQEELNLLRNVEQKLKQAERDYEAAIQAANQARQEASDPLFAGMSPQEAWDKANLDADEVDLEEPASGGTLAAGLLLLAGALATAAAGVLLTPFAFLGTALLLVGGIILLVQNVRLKRQAATIQEEREEILTWYGVEDSEEILALAREYRAGWESAHEAERERQNAEQTLIDLKNERERLRAQVLPLVQGFAPGAKDAFTLSAAISKALFLQEKLEQAAIRREGAEKLVQRLPAPQEVPEAVPDVEPRYDGTYTAVRLSAVEGEIGRLNSVLAMAQGELKTLGDPAQTQADLERAQETLALRRQEYEAITLALEGLEEANRSMQARFAPALNERAGELMERLTGGRYDRVTITREFEAMAEERDGMLPRRVLSLSRGTADQLYLAVRLAVCELALPDANAAPLVLDDALANFDDGRMKLALDVLRSLGRERQILLFTCHSREGNYLSEAYDVQHIPLSSRGEGSNLV